MTTEKHFLDMTKDEQEKINKLDIVELMHYYGGWSELKKVIESMEDNHNEAAWERSQNQSQ